jgi:hypothetical protein
MRKADKIAGVSVLQPGLAIGTVAFVVWLGALWTEFHS